MADDLTPFTSTGLCPGPVANFQQWWQLGEQIAAYEERTSLTFTWLWGDWLRGLKRWPNQYDDLTGAIGRGDGYRRLEALTGKPFGTLKNMAWLAGVYSLDGQPDPIRGLPVRQCHFEICAAIGNREQRNNLLRQVAETGMTRRQLKDERDRLFPELAEEPAALPGDLQFEETVTNHLLETAIQHQAVTINRLNGNITEARQLLEGITDLPLEQGEVIQQAIRLLEPRTVPVDVVHCIFDIIEAYRNGEVQTVLEGVGRLAEMRGLLE